MRKGGGVFTNPSGIEIPRVSRVKTKNLPWGGMDNFWNNPIQGQIHINVVFQKLKKLDKMTTQDTADQALMPQTTRKLN